MNRMISARHFFPVRLFVAMLFIAATAGIFAAAGDECWVRRCYSWNGIGTLTTGRIKLFGDDIRIRYASPSNGMLRITVYDAAGENPKAPKQIIYSRNLQHTGSRTLSGYKEIWLHIEGDDKNWIVEVDQYMSRIQEWRWKKHLAQPEIPLSPEAEWGGAESQIIEYTPSVVPCRFYFTSSGPGKVSLAVRNGDDKLFYSSLLEKNGESPRGWLCEPGKYIFRVVSADSEWTVNVEAE